MTRHDTATYDPRYDTAHTGSTVTGGDFFKIIAAIIIPPLGVFLEVGLTKHFWINLLLTILLPWIGGFIHAMYIILTRR